VIVLRLASALGQILAAAQGAAAAQTSVAVKPEDPPNEIVVRAVRGKCAIVRDGVTLGRRDADAFAEGWPQEQPLRIVEPIGADYHCLADIAFKLQRKGVLYIEFVPRRATK
jgi:hypothetical protein